MSGIDPSRDTQGEIDIIGATIPLAPPSASVNAGYVKFTNTRITGEVESSPKDA